MHKSITSEQNKAHLQKPTYGKLRSNAETWDEHEHVPSDLQLGQNQWETYVDCKIQK